MELKNLKLTDIKPYGKNPRKNDGAVDAVAESIKQYGYCSPIDYIDKIGGFEKFAEWGLINV